MPTSGLAGSVAHTVWTSENLLLFRNASRKREVCFWTLLYASDFDRMMAQDATEMTIKIARTA